MEFNGVCVEEIKRRCFFFVFFLRLLFFLTLQHRRIALVSRRSRKRTRHPRPLLPSGPGRCLAATVFFSLPLRYCERVFFFSLARIHFFFYERFHQHKGERKELLYRRLTLRVARARLLNVKRKKKMNNADKNQYLISPDQCVR